MTENESAVEGLDGHEPSLPEVGVVAATSLAEAVLSRGVEEEGFGVRDKEEVSGIRELFEEVDWHEKFCPWDCLLSWNAETFEREER